MRFKRSTTVFHSPEQERRLGVPSGRCAIGEPLLRDTGRPERACLKPLRGLCPAKPVRAGQPSPGGNTGSAMRHGANDYGQRLQALERHASFLFAGCPCARPGNLGHGRSSRRTQEDQASHSPHAASAARSSTATLPARGQVLPMAARPSDGLAARRLYCAA